MDTSEVSRKRRH